MMSLSCHCHADAVGFSASQDLVDGGFALSGYTSAVFAGVLADPLLLSPPLH